MTLMTIPLKDLIATAESRLDARARERLAELVESFVATFEGPLDFSAEELARLKEIDAEPFAPADEKELAAFLARHG